MTQTAATTWNIDPAHSVAEFKVKHMMISNVKGHFAKVTGTLTLDESDLNRSRVEALIEAASLETRDAQRDAHLKSADFFDVEKFPTLSFQSTRINLVRDGELAIEGDLTIRGVTRKVVFSAEGPTPPAKDIVPRTPGGFCAAAASTANPPMEWPRSSTRDGSIQGKCLSWSRAPSTSAAAACPAFR